MAQVELQPTFSKRVSMSSIDNEVELQRVCFDSLGCCPEIFNVTEAADGESDGIIHMAKIQAETIAWHYGDDPSEVPVWIFDQIREILANLLEQEGVEYVDITAYNFLLVGERVYIIDFGHATWIDNPPRATDDFLAKFLGGKNMWNPNFA